MKIFHGTSRTVIALGNLVFKFPRYSLIFKIILRICKYPFGKVLWQSVRRDRRAKFITIFDGIFANWTEYVASFYFKSPVLAPVYISIGLFSVQKYIVGETVSYSELRGHLKRMSKESLMSFGHVTVHCWDESNFVKTRAGVIMVDYGDVVLNENRAITSWLMDHVKALEKALLKNPPD